jgi:hypothetical protein
MVIGNANRGVKPMIRASKLIEALQEQIEKHGDGVVEIEVRDGGMHRRPHQQETARIEPDHWGNIVTGCIGFTITAHLEKGCKITTSKELKESRRKFSHEWVSA